MNPEEEGEEQMEIHEPHGPAHSLKEFLMQLLTITCGVLIALGFEGLVQWQHHRHLVGESAANLASEIRENRDTLGRALEQMGTTQGQLRAIMSVVRQLRADRAAKPGDTTLSTAVTTLAATAWSTAAGTGALGFMKYRDVARYTRIYDQQQQFMDVERRFHDAMLELESYGPLLQGSYRRVSDAQFIDAERAVGRAQVATQIVQDIGKALDDEYGAFLGGK
jgi:hypothetical protein